MSVHRPIVVVQGANWGSEAKGLVASALCENRDIRYAVRTGAINAGHTVYYKGRPYKMQQLPTGWTNPGTKLVIGPGAYIHWPTLLREVQLIAQATGATADQVWSRILIDYRVGQHLPRHEQEATEAGRHLTMGATGKGCAESIINKISARGNDEAPLLLFWNGVGVLVAKPPQSCKVDVPHILNEAYDRSDSILIEGTQGTHLDLHTGPYPYTTSRMTSAANWVAEAGLSPALDYEVILVARTYPIRVAGNSGPMRGLEVSWPELARSVNRKLVGAGREPLVEECNIRLFEQTVAEQAGMDPRYTWPDWSGPLDQHKWTGEERERHLYTLSNLYSDALKTIGAGHDPGALEDLSKLFEYTTVTKKLRRIAAGSLDQLAETCLTERPTYIALTFLNYDYPTFWNASVDEIRAQPEILRDAEEYIRTIEVHTRTQVRWVGVGPENRHLHHMYDLLK